MSKGGGGDQTSTVYQSSLPQYAEPFYKQLMTRGVAESTRPYQPYNAPRLAGPDRLTNQGIAQASAFGRSNLGMLPGAERLTQQVGNKAYGLSSYGSKFQPGQFGSAEASQYMSPYMDAVTERAKAGAAQDYAEQRVFNQSDAARAGAFGGSRQAVMDAIAQRSLMDRMSDITVQGRQSAFENAQQQYERDRAARGQAEQFRQGAQQLNLGALGLGKESAGQLADMSKQQDAMRLQRMQSLLGAGQLKEDYKQKGLDLAYNDFVNQRDVERQNLQFLSSLLQGVPVSANQNVVQTTPSNPIAGAVGTMSGLQALYALGRSS